MNMTPTEHYEAALVLTNKAAEDHGTGHSGALVTAVRGLTHAILAARPAPEPADPVDYSARRELADHLADAFAAGDSSYEAVADRLLAQGYRLVWQAPAAPAAGHGSPACVPVEQCVCTRWDASA